MSKKVFFLDRDGVINIDHGYIYKPEQFEFIPGVFEACKMINQQGYEIVVVTNQSGIGRGYYTEQDFIALTTWMTDKFSEQGVAILDVYYCPHHATHGINNYLQDCDCRKPKPGMLLNASLEHDIDVNASVIVGDKTSDMEAGKRAGVGTFYKVSGLNEGISYTGEWFNCSRLLDATTHFFQTRER